MKINLEIIEPKKEKFSYSACTGFGGEDTVQERNKGIRKFVEKVCPLIKGKKIQRILTPDYRVVGYSSKRDYSCVSPAEISPLDRRLMPFHFTRSIIFILDGNILSFVSSSDDSIDFGYNENSIKACDLRTFSPEKFSQLCGELRQCDAVFDISYGFYDILGQTITDITLDGPDDTGSIEFLFSNGKKLGYLFEGEQCDSWFEE